MREALRKVLRFITPKTAVGFLAYGWVGGATIGMLSAAFTGYVGFVVSFLFYVPLYVLADRARARQIEIAKFVSDVQYQVEIIEEEEEEKKNGRADSNDEG